jgi:acyl-coenzyme A synthetase/AMP-(fatty) acid ligase
MIYGSNFAASADLLVIQEIMKVRGFQVAPAELEGCILNHPDVADTCVVSVPDEYSGEIPLAFVVLRVSAATRVGKNPREIDVAKASIMKVGHVNISITELSPDIVV